MDGSPLPSLFQNIPEHRQLRSEDYTITSEEFARCGSRTILGRQDRVCHSEFVRDAHICHPDPAHTLSLDVLAAGLSYLNINVL
jgi:hypothetical protein